jgi:hypothetical protein
MTLTVKTSKYRLCVQCTYDTYHVKDGIKCNVYYFQNHLCGIGRRKYHCVGATRATNMFNFVLCFHDENLKKVLQICFKCCLEISQLLDKAFYILYFMPPVVQHGRNS